MKLPHQQPIGVLDWTEHDRLLAEYQAMPPQRAKWSLNNLHLEGKLSGEDLAYWLATLNIDPSL